MNTIDRYIFRELIKVFAISVCAATLLLYLDKFLFMAEMIVNRGVSFIEMLRIMVYISPSFLALTIPISVLVASVVTFNQFSASNEWIAMKFSSRSFLDLLKPVFIFSLLTYILANAVIFYALPWGNHSYKKLIFDIIRHRANFDIKPNVFYKDFDNLVLLVKERDNDSRMRGVFIANGQESGQPQIISAEEGIIFSDPDSFKIQLKLKNGTIHEFNKERKDYQTLNFKGYDLSLRLPSTEKLEKKALMDNRDRALSQQLERIERLKKEGRPMGPLWL